MSNLGNAYVLATALYGKDRDRVFSDRLDYLYHCVNILGFGSDERKADLYATLAEGLTSDMTFAEACSAIEAAMDKTDERYPPI